MQMRNVQKCQYHQTDKILFSHTGMKELISLSPSFLQVYANGIRNIDLHFIVRRLAAPVICVLLLCLCLPYTVSKGVTPLLGMSLETSVSLRDVWIFLYLSVHNKDHFLVVRGLISAYSCFLSSFPWPDERWPNEKIIPLI